MGNSQMNVSDVMMLVMNVPVDLKMVVINVNHQDTYTKLQTVLFLNLVLKNVQKDIGEMMKPKNVPPVKRLMNIVLNVLLSLGVPNVKLLNTNMKVNVFHHVQK